MFMQFIQKPMVAVLLLALGMGLIPLNDSLIKVMGEEYPLLQIITLRGLLSLLMIFLLPGAIDAARQLSLKSWRRLGLRGTMLVCTMMCFFTSLATLKLADAVALFFMSPLFIAVFSVPFLGERLGPRRICAVIIGFIGVLLITRPGGEAFQLGHILALTAGLFYALFQVYTRHLRAEATLLAMVGVQHICYVAIAFVIGIILHFANFPYHDNAQLELLLRPWAWPDGKAIIFLIICAFLVLFLSFTSTNAYKNVEATYVAPFEYTSLPMAIIWGYIIWGEQPDNFSYIGISLILAGGFILIYREKMHETDIASSAPLTTVPTDNYHTNDTGQKE
jgi:drug/metabolite transporter (DMT)-like permease